MNENKYIFIFSGLRREFEICESEVLNFTSLRITGEFNLFSE